MKFQPPAIIRAGVFLLVPLFSALAASDQLSILDELASQIAKEVKPFKPQLVAVADFRPPYGGTTPHGHYFAAVLSRCLEDRANHKFTVANHTAFDSDLEKMQISGQSLTPGSGNFRSAVSQIGAEVLLTGTIENEPARISFKSRRFAWPTERFSQLAAKPSWRTNFSIVSSRHSPRMLPMRTTNIKTRWNALPCPDVSTALILLTIISLDGTRLMAYWCFKF
jgi:hypothetical protein